MAAQVGTCQGTALAQFGERPYHPRAMARAVSSKVLSRQPRDVETMSALV